MADGRSARARPRSCAAVAADEHAVVEEAGHQRHAEPAGQVVVARARRADGVRPGALAQRAHRRLRCDAGQRLERTGDVRAREAEVAMAPVALGDHEAAVDELSQVHARRGGRDAGLRGQHAGGQLAAIGQRAQHAGAARIADEGAHRGEIGVSGHAPRVAARHFVVRRSLAVLPSSA